MKCILLQKCLLICLMLGVSLQGVAVSFAPGCELAGRHGHGAPAAPPDHTTHHAMHASNTGEHEHVVASANHHVCEGCNDCAACIVLPVPVTPAPMFSIMQSQAPVTLRASLFLNVILEDPPRPPSDNSLLI